MSNLTTLRTDRDANLKTELLPVFKKYKWSRHYVMEQKCMKAAKEEKMEAQSNIGFFYKQGDFVKRNFKKAVYWYSLAAKQGDTEAQRDLGYCYFYGKGIKKDKYEAVAWYKRAASKRDSKALYNLGLCYEFGDGVKQSTRWATHYYSKSSKTRTFEVKRRN